MIKFQKAVIWLPVFIVNLACAETSSKSAEIEAIKAELETIESEIESNKKIDRNGDGTPDLFIELDGEFLYELVDRNFDGVVDESWKYNSKDVLISGKVDENLDGYLETKYLSKDLSFHKILSDTDKNGVFDVYTNLIHGVVTYSEKYYKSNKGPHIGKVDYLYGHPTGPETLIPTLISEKDFERSRLNDSNDT